MDHEHFYSANRYYKTTYGEKVYRLALDGGMTCPNRDGRTAFGGCTFCSEKGSGDFTVYNEGSSGNYTVYNEGNSGDFPVCGESPAEAVLFRSKRSPAFLSSCNAKQIEKLVEVQIDEAKKLVSAKAGKLYIAYFQSFTNTYAPVNYLDVLFSAALKGSDIAALSIATRPDCIDRDIICLLLSLRKKYRKDIYVELGLQTTNDKVAAHFNRGYDYPVFLTALKLLKNADIPVIVHMILGLPGESENDIVQNVSDVSGLGIHGIKLSLLHLLKGTAMEREYFRSPERFHMTDKQTYIRTLCRCIEHIPETVVIYRITGDAPKKLLTAPEFTADKKAVLNSIHKYMKEHDIIQGRRRETAAVQTGKR